MGNGAFLEWGLFIPHYKPKLGLKLRLYQGIHYSSQEVYTSYTMTVAFMNVVIIVIFFVSEALL